jgi:pimeloyl-ACP methyl ester carboxylesterase
MTRKSGSGFMLQSLYYSAIASVYNRIFALLSLTQTKKIKRQLNAVFKIEGRTTIIDTHGFLGMLDNWKTLGVQFATEGFQVHMLDMRNHGRSIQSEEFSYKIMAKDIYDYCQANNLSNIDLIGHSMGGRPRCCLLPLIQK